jgi:hypothetical protein
MKKYLLLLFSITTFYSFPQFLSPEINWTSPNGGKISGNITYGFNATSGAGSALDNTGSQTWGLMDMNGDGRQDLVVTAQLQAGNVTCFSPGNNQYWKIYLNTGSGFASTPTNWSLPNGGKLSGGTNYGYDNFSGIASSTDDTGSQTWAVMDMNGDSKPDLVVTAQLQGGDVTCFSPGLNQYWNVYLNTGSGFSNLPIMWSLPNGGKLTSGIIYGFDHVAGTALMFHNTGSQTWNIMDIDGDKKPDLIVSAQLQGGYVTSFSPSFNQYWKIYLNTGSGFSSAPTNWNLPNGGKLTSGITYGYNGISGYAFTSDNTGSQTWALVNMTGDSKPELVITSQLQGGDVTCFSPGLNPYWIVYDNSGTGFSSQTNWSLPLGGKINNAVIYGYNSLAGMASTSDNTGSQTWSVVDFDGDSYPELVVTAQLQGGFITSFSPGLGQYWKLYPSTGTGFRANPINCTLPQGGKIDSGTNFGFNSISGSAFGSDDTGSQTWSMAELTGDGKPDLIVSAQLQGGNVTSFSPGPGQYWKVYTSDVVTTLKETLGEDIPNFITFPNPCNGTFFVKGDKPEMIQVLNTVGQTIQIVELNTENNYTYEVKEFPSGLYVLKGNTTVTRVLVSK